MSLFSSFWCRGLAAVCDCGTPWTFLLSFFVCVGDPIKLIILIKCYCLTAGSFVKSDNSDAYLFVIINYQSFFLYIFGAISIVLIKKSTFLVLDNIVLIEKFGGNFTVKEGGGLRGGQTGSTMKRPRGRAG